MDPKTAGLLGRTALRLDPRAFTIASVSPSYEKSVRIALADVHAPCIVQFLPHEVSIVLAEEEWTHIRSKFPGAHEETGYRLITLDVALDWEVTGYLAAVTATMAEAGIPVGVLSSFHHDHLLVRGDRVENAVAALQRLIQSPISARSVPPRPASRLRRPP